MKINKNMLLSILLVVFLVVLFTPACFGAEIKVHTIDLCTKLQCNEKGQILGKKDMRGDFVPNHKGLEKNKLIIVQKKPRKVNEKSVLQSIHRTFSKKYFNIKAAYIAGKFWYVEVTNKYGVRKMVLQIRPVIRAPNSVRK